MKHVYFTLLVCLFVVNAASGQDWMYLSGNSPKESSESGYTPYYNDIYKVNYGLTCLLSETLPGNLPVPEVITINNPAPGGIFMSPFAANPAADTAKYKNYLMILDTTGAVVSYKLLPYKGYVGYHFKPETNGLLSYLARTNQLGVIDVTDTSYNKLYSLRDSVNPYKRVRYYARFDIQPNGNILTARYDFQYVDLSKVVPNGEPNGATLQAVVQELDKDKNVVFQWRSLDYVPITNTQQNVLAAAIEYFHPNSMVLDRDGNLLISARNQNAIIKINRNTGEVMWTLGGKGNQFQFIGEHEENAPNYFSYQHDIRVLPNGNITLFDNGVQHNPKYSRGVEYELDQINKTCKLVWEYRHTPDFYAEQHGNMQRLPNGNTFIAWGTSAVDTINGGVSFTEIHPDKSIAMEMKLPKGFESQFIYKYPWPVCPLIASVTKNELLALNTYEFNGETKTGISMTIDELDGVIYNKLQIDKYECSPVNPEFTGRPPVVSPYRIVMRPTGIFSLSTEMRLDLTEYPLIFQPLKTKVYFRAQEGSGAFIPLETTYDEANNELVATIDAAAGELVFGYPDLPEVPQGPFLYTPLNNEKPNKNFPVIFTWNPKGYFTGSQLQIASDVDFNNIVRDTTTRLIAYSTADFNDGANYYWRVRSINEAGNGNWSDIRSFNAAEPYLELLTPNGGEVLEKGKTKHVFRWNYNVKDSSNAFFKVELLRNGEPVLINGKPLKDSLFSAVNAFGWIIPDSPLIPEDTTYQVRVTSLSDPSLTDISSGNFTIKGSTAVDDKPAEEIINTEVYPNPFETTASFVFSTKNPGYATLKVYSMEGREIASLVDGYLESGSYRYNWAPQNIESGVYTYVLRIGSLSRTGQVVLIK